MRLLLRQYLRQRRRKDRCRKLVRNETKQNKKKCLAQTHSVDNPLGHAYTERRRQCCYIVSDSTLIKLLTFLNKPIEFLQKWVATPIGQILHKC